MKKVVHIVLILLMLTSINVSAGEWDDLVRDALKQSPSKSKRRTRSGKRLLREKMERIRQIDRDMPFVIQRGDYDGAENLLKESLRLTIELYDENDIHVADRFVSLGIVYMEAGDPGKAEEVFEIAIGIAETILGAGSFKLFNVYKFLAAAYYEQGKIEKAEDVAAMLLLVCRNKFGDKDQRTKEAREFLSKIYSGQK